jgi:hypothetical protein
MTTWKEAIELFKPHRNMTTLIIVHSYWAELQKFTQIQQMASLDRFLSPLVKTFGAITQILFCFLFARSIIRQMISSSPKNSIIDDTMSSVDTVEEAMELYNGVKAVYSSCSMKLHKIASNDENLLSSIPDVERAKGFQSDDFLSGHHQQLQLWDYYGQVRQMFILLKL